VISVLRRHRAARRGIVYCRGGRRVARIVALTFDDGPSRWTPPILDALAGAGARATFFVLGASIAGQEETLRRAVADGHELGNHAWSHADPAELDDETLRAELLRTTTALAEATGVRPRLFRPPYAEADARVAAVARSAALAPTVLRSVDPADWRATDAGEIVRSVVEGATPGAIVCLHDGRPPTNAGSGTRSATVAAVEQLVVELPALGYRLVTVSELLG
jgi:peptidoglycan/xylan/chitin deacetylase (PgdA/CDA1 family)